MTQLVPDDPIHTMLRPREELLGEAQVAMLRAAVKRHTAATRLLEVGVVANIPSDPRLGQKRPEGLLRVDPALFE